MGFADTTTTGTRSESRRALQEKRRRREAAEKRRKRAAALKKARNVVAFVAVVLAVSLFVAYGVLFGASGPAELGWGAFWEMLVPGEGK